METFFFFNWKPTEVFNQSSDQVATEQYGQMSQQPPENATGKKTLDSEKRKISRIIQ